MRTLALVSALFSAPAASGQTAVLANGGVRAEFGARGVISIAAGGPGRMPHLFRADEFAVTLDGTTYESETLPAPSRKASGNEVVYSWTAGPYRLDVVYELEAGWRFLSKQIVVMSAHRDRFRVDAVTVLRGTLAEAVDDVYIPRYERQNLGLGDYGAALRFSGGRGLLALVQNPFLESTASGRDFAVSFRPGMEWSAADGPFVSDRGLLVPYRLSGRRQAAAMLPEWRVGSPDEATGLDASEVEAFTETVRALLVFKPEKPTTVFVGWCVNDYQIDIATEEGRTEYKRIIDRAADLGAEHVLFAPTNSDLARREDSVDDWNWENLLWLGLGQKIRRNEWDPKTDLVPAAVQEMIDYAKSRRMRLLAYVYPVVAFSQNPGWLATRRSSPGGKKYASLGVRSLQDWLIETLVAFHHRTGISGYAFDHTFLTFDGTSAYAQWWGWRRVMETLRERIPDIVVDGRQAYHLYGPWSWLAGTYPHPTYNDEQPESFVPFPDLSVDRVSAARQRYTAYRYRHYDFAPTELVPGFITHQTGRNDDTGRMPETKTEKGILLNRFRARDWDYLGWRYSLLSSVATAGWNHVLNMIPARDLEEDRHFSEADRAWVRRWLQWTADHKEFLRNTRTILGQPAIGKVDGTAAFKDGRGFVFLFNPNARRLPAALPLNRTLGLTGQGPYLVRELHPQEGRAIGKPGAGVWTNGDVLTIEMDGQSAVVLEIGPAPVVATPLLFGASGSATLTSGALDLRGVRGEVGTSASLQVLVPKGLPVTSARVNGRGQAFAQPRSGVVELDVRFAGEPFRQAQPVIEFEAGFTGGTARGTFTVPARVFDQLSARQTAWPIPWTADDFRSTWLAPQRLLLYLQIAEPDDRWEPRLRIDGRLIELRKAYSAIWAARRTFVGFYADVSLLSPDREYQIELELPKLDPGRYQGLFFQNVESEYTDAIVP